MNKQDFRKFLVTGGAGFLGRAVVSRLEAAGYQVFVPRSTEFDLVQPDAAKSVYEKSQPDVVIHLAGSVGGIGANIRNPGRYLYENLMMGLLVMEYARLFGVQKFVSVGTVCAYPKYATVPFREDDLWNGYPEESNAPYGLAKKMLLVQGQAYRQQYGLNAIYLLPSNIFGPSDNFNLLTSHVIPAIIRKCVDAVAEGNREIVVWGTGRATREFLYVEDAAEGIMLAAERYDKPEPINLGVGQEISIRELVYLIVELTEFKGKVIWDASKPDGQPRRCLDVSKAQWEFGFKAKTDLETGLRRTIEWYKAHRKESLAHGE